MVALHRGHRVIPSGGGQRRQGKKKEATSCSTSGLDPHRIRLVTGQIRAPFTARSLAMSLWTPTPMKVKQFSAKKMKGKS
jgi:hypothetical protein